MVYDREDKGESNRSSDRRLGHGDESVGIEDPLVVSGMGGEGRFLTDRHGYVVLSFSNDSDDSDTFQVYAFEEVSNTRHGVLREDSEVREARANPSLETIERNHRIIGEFLSGNRGVGKEVSFGRLIQWLVYMGWEYDEVKVERMKACLEAREGEPP